jgi:D-glycero-alpha-D-manno-heptose-7-phosphate kinase
MIISKTPFRISFFGGGTDYPQWYLKEGGAVLSTTIDKYCYITCRILPPFFTNKYRIVWSHIENVNSPAEILHPAVRAGLSYLGLDLCEGMEIHHQGDLPARSGMGSSSAFAVGLIHALTALQGQMISKHDLALKAIDLEQNQIRENVGSQDQVASAFGGLNHITFLTNGDIRIEPVTVSARRIKDLEERLMLVYTGTSRLSSEIAKQTIASFDQKQQVLQKMHSMVNEAINILNSDADLDAFGRLLHEGWELKRSLNDAISNPTIDKIYRMALEGGAIGGKLLGAGASGFMVLYIPPAKKKEVKESLSPYLHVPFKFENDGSTIIYYSPKD